MPEPFQRQTASAKEVAAMLGWRCVESFYANRPRLEARGFPKPLPGLARATWSVPAVRQWFEANGERPREAQPRKVVSALEARYAQ